MSIANEKEPEFLALNGCKKIENRRKWLSFESVPVFLIARLIMKFYFMNFHFLKFHFQILFQTGAFIAFFQ